MISLRSFALSLFLILIALINGKSQPSRTPHKSKKDSPIGFGVNLGNIRFYNSSFEFGLAPNVAYKLGESVAVGFMLKLDYYYSRYRSLDLKYSSFDLGPTLFTRWKPLWTMDGATPFLQGLFLQAEYEKAFIAREKTDEFGNIIVNGNHIETVRNAEDYLYIGLGASSGYPFSTFVSLHYNVLDKPELTRIPLSYRIGFTYNY